jgi:hypothetical protein
LHSERYSSITGRYNSDSYSYNNEARSFTRTPSMVIQGGNGFIELEVYDKNTSKMYYRGIINFDVTTGHASATVATDLIKKMAGSSIKLIKQEDNKMIIQVINVSKSYLVFKINRASRDVFAYLDFSLDELTENVITTIS